MIHNNSDNLFDRIFNIGLFFEPNPSNMLMYFEQSSKRTENAGYRHPTPEEMYNYFCNYNLSDYVMPFNGSLKWLNIAYLLEGNLLSAAFDPKNLAWDFTKGKSGDYTVIGDALIYSGEIISCDITDAIVSDKFKDGRHSKSCYMRNLSRNFIERSCGLNILKDREFWSDGMSIILPSEGFWRPAAAVINKYGGFDIDASGDQWGSLGVKEIKGSYLSGLFTNTNS